MTRAATPNNRANSGTLWEQASGPDASRQGRRYTPLVLRPTGGADLIMVAQETPPATAPRPDVPTSVYRYYDHRNILLYVGVTSRGIARNVEHNTSKEWFQYVTRQEVEHFPNRAKALRRETELIRQYRPPFNKQQNPGHELTRQAYLAWGAIPSVYRPSLMKPGKYPKTLLFVPHQQHNDELLLTLDTPVRSDWSVVNPCPRIMIKNTARKKVGRLISVQRIGDMGAMRAKFEFPVYRVHAIALGVKWPPSQPGGFEVLNAQAHLLPNAPR